MAGVYVGPFKRQSTFASRRRGHHPPASRSSASSRNGAVCQTLNLQRVFGGGAALFAAFFVYAAVRQLTDPYGVVSCPWGCEGGCATPDRSVCPTTITGVAGSPHLQRYTGELRPVTHSNAVLAVLLLQAASLALVAAAMLRNLPRPGKATRGDCARGRRPGHMCRQHSPSVAACCECCLERRKLFLFVVVLPPVTSSTAHRAKCY